MQNESSDFNRKEWTALSVVKFICVAVMIFVPIHIMLVTDFDAFKDTSGFFYLATNNLMFISLFVFMLPIIAGVIFRMDLGKNIVDDKLRNYDFKKIINIAIFLTLAGFFMNIAVAGIWHIFSWNILQLMGLSLIIITVLVYWFSVQAVFLLGAITLFAAEPLRNFLATFGHNYISSVLVGANDYFTFWPLFPWFSVIAFGFLFAHYYLKYQDSIKFRLASLLVGTMLVMVAVMRGEVSPYLDPKYFWGSSLFQPKIGFVLAVMGLFCILIIVANYFFNDTKLKKYGIVNSYSKGILWIYIIQMFVSYKLSTLAKNFFSIDSPSIVYFSLIIFMFLLCWPVGALSIKLLHEKLIVVTLKKIQ